MALEPGVPAATAANANTAGTTCAANVRSSPPHPIDGTFAEYVAIAADFAHPIPDSISDDGAGLIEPLSVVSGPAAKPR